MQTAYIFRPTGQGIWADVARTRKAGLTSDIAHSVLLSEGYEERPPDGDRFEYAYPRQSNRSESEVLAMKAAMRVQMPIFFVDGLKHPGRYVVRLAWVIDANDSAEMPSGFVPPSAPEIRKTSLTIPLPTGRGVRERKRDGDASARATRVFIRLCKTLRNAMRHVRC